MQRINVTNVRFLLNEYLLTKLFKIVTSKHNAITVQSTVWRNWRNFLHSHRSIFQTSTESLFKVSSKYQISIIRNFSHRSKSLYLPNKISINEKPTKQTHISVSYSSKSQAKRFETSVYSYSIVFSRQSSRWIQCHGSQDHLPLI